MLKIQPLREPRPSVRLGTASAIPVPTAAALKRHRLRLGNERGYTLIEMVISLALGLVVLTAVLLTSSAVYRDSANENARSTALTQATTGVANMVQILDQAYHVNGPSSVSSSNWIDVEVRIPGTGVTRVLYNCGVADSSTGYNECVRYEVAGTCGSGCTAGTAPSCTGCSAVVVSRVLNGTSSKPVFTNLATPSGSGSEITYGNVTIDTPSGGERASTSTYTHQVVLSNAFYIRQLDFGR